MKTLTDDEVEKKKKTVLNAWNGWEAGITEITRTFHVSRKFLRDVVEAALVDGTTQCPIRPPRSRLSRTGRA